MRSGGRPHKRHSAPVQSPGLVWSSQPLEAASLIGSSRQGKAAGRGGQMGSSPPFFSLMCIPSPTARLYLTLRPTHSSAIASFVLGSSTRPSLAPTHLSAFRQGEH
ncbi:hypothetical protein COCCADRAFT_84301 [Bipolaris zeicola 26-R-13]|uniref:Uncharacterized protein n=1 Tax=Cochliobolus carbonum (strain 26-R-13) TaxID=930089 RepID=W6YJU9_COCC2|nr:uncharacterized protein COCCADRAFT_84301 [Bipolaris zeicola 26-R-13]EUC37933.1 hypothetical protein COCCADRAFT_84301 [Bipolaris zeicola 26-R-13]